MTVHDRLSVALASSQPSTSLMRPLGIQKCTGRAGPHPPYGLKTLSDFSPCALQPMSLSGSKRTWRCPSCSAPALCPAPHAPNLHHSKHSIVRSRTCCECDAPHVRPRTGLRARRRRRRRQWHQLCCTVSIRVGATVDQSSRTVAQPKRLTRRRAANVVVREMCVKRYYGSYKAVRFLTTPRKL